MAALRLRIHCVMPLSAPSCGTASSASSHITVFHHRFDVSLSLPSAARKEAARAGSPLTPERLAWEADVVGGSLAWLASRLADSRQPV
jgi:hypothetical protein